ncbi:hypothetical protein SNEBB_011099 [Seison nebaliae]|nr:hypothetical protein SNEBB_011099 [Seison nebaliae]
MDKLWNIADDNDEVVEGGDWRKLVTRRTGKIFLVDVRYDMKEEFSLNDGGKSCGVKLAFDSMEKEYKDTVFMNDKDCLSTIVFGDESFNEEIFPHLKILTPMDEMRIESVMKIKKFDWKSLSKDCKEMKFSDLLWTAMQIFQRSKKQFSMKEIILWTAADIPSNDTVEMKLLKKRLSDLKEENIDVKLFGCNKNFRFDHELFWKDALEWTNDDLMKNKLKLSSLSNIQIRLRNKTYQQRVYSNLKLKLCSGTELSVAIYNVCRKCAKPKRIKLDKKKNVDTKTVTSKMDVSTGSLLMPNEISTKYTINSQEAIFTSEELKILKYFGGSNLKLIGFKPLSFLQPYHYLKTSHVLYPTGRENNQGNIRCFTTLLSCCLKRKLFVLCEMVLRKNSPPYLVALIPQKPKIDLKANEIVDGSHSFNVIYLPHMTDIREINRVNDVGTESMNPEKMEEKVEVSKEIIKKLSNKKFACDLLPNPALQVMWRNIEAIALDEKDLPEVKDYTMPSTEMMNKKCGELFEKFNSINLTVEKTKVSRKRTAATTSSRAKKTK